MRLWTMSGEAGPGQVLQGLSEMRMCKLKPWQMASGGCTEVKLIELYIYNICSLPYTNQTSIKLLKNESPSVQWFGKIYINRNKMVIFYTRNNWLEYMIASTIPAKIIKHLGINLIKHMITLWGHFKNLLKNRRDVHLMRGLNIIKSTPL